MSDWPGLCLEWFDGETLAWVAGGVALIAFLVGVWHLIDWYTGDIGF